LPEASRVVACPQSSTTTYWYPAALIPELTIASAAARILDSLMSQPKVFQLFQPNGGRTAGLPAAAEAGETKRSSRNGRRGIKTL
jgi:hypothetical protein